MVRTVLRQGSFHLRPFFGLQTLVVICRPYSRDAVGNFMSSSEVFEDFVGHIGNHACAAQGIEDVNFINSPIEPFIDPSIHVWAVTGVIVHRV
jgi:hypothetical protein